MLNQAEDRGVDQRGTSQWCVGEPPLRWDVPFGARLAEKIRQIFWRDTGERAIPIHKTVEEPRVVMRKAA